MAVPLEGIPVTVSTLHVATLAEAPDPVVVAIGPPLSKALRLKANNLNRDKKDNRNVDVDDALELLQGLPLGADLKTNLFKWHETHGADAFKDYVQSLKRNTAVDPGDRSDTAANFDALGGKIPEVAMKYQDEGTERVQLAMKINAEFDELQEIGSGMKTSREDYIARNSSCSVVTGCCKTTI